ncbi:LLM class flavin-dependent oxidoreductase [Agrococcus sediminis]|uniref:LLM class flavin-dependent oxidoreductase n=2 Tax=Agrococcus sediminis TaxID=2599924 RepID=A0A5M8QC60_9MICO|nr:LLM class flavin-dependent oxidoreductase [Agrococcus sediminis]
MPMPIEFGVHTFAAVPVVDGAPLSHAQVLRDVVAEGVAADRQGLAFFGVGEHHRDDFAASAPEILLGALATATERIRLGTAVTVLSSNDPVRVFEQFSTLDGISSGRAEMIVGRGSFVESFPLFGYRLEDYEALFEERLELLAALVREEPVTWSGTLRSPLHEQPVYPRSHAAEHGGRIPVWVGVGGSPESVIRTARHGFDMMLAIIGGSPAQFAPFAGLYRKAMEQFGHAPGRIGMHSPGLVAETDAEAKRILMPQWMVYRNRIGRERGWGDATEREFDASMAEHGAMFAGSPETVAQKIVWAKETLGVERFDLKYDSGTSHEDNLRSIELFGTEVVPRVRALLGEA